MRSVLRSRWFRIVISAALLAVLLRGTDLHAMRSALARASGVWVVVALLLSTTSQVAAAYRWALLARAVGFTERFSRFCTYYFTGMYLNLFGPGTVAGDLGRVLFLAAGRRRALALTTVIAHRATGFVALAWITATFAAILPSSPLPGPLRVVAALTLPVTLAAWLWGPRLAARLLPAANRWRIMIERDLAPYWHDRKLLAMTLGWAMVVHGLQITAQKCLAFALGLDLPWTFFLVIVPLVTMGSTLPFSLQGIGLREASYWYYLAQLGVPREQALALGLLASAMALALGLTGLPAFLLLRRSKALPPDPETSPAPASPRR